MSQVGKPLAFIPVLAFMLLGVFWGSNFIYMKLASNLLSTTQIVFFRVLFGFLPVLIYSWLSGALAWSQLKYIGHYFVMALIATTFYYYFFVKGTSLLLSGVAGAISGSIPLFTFILAVIFLKEEKVSTQRVIGVLVGLFGVFLIAGPSGQELLHNQPRRTFLYSSRFVKRRCFLCLREKIYKSTENLAICINNVSTWPCPPSLICSY